MPFNPPHQTEVMALQREHARAEAAIGRAHRAVWTAWESSTQMGWDGLTMDMEMMLAELERVQFDLLMRPLPARVRQPSDGDAESRA